MHKFSLILTINGKYKKTIYRCNTRETVFIHYNKLISENKDIKFPKKYINTKKIFPVKYKICVTKPTEEGDTFRMLRDDFGRTYVEKPINGWTILASNDYNVEETFWIFGEDIKVQRPDINLVVKKLMQGAYKKNFVKQIIVVHNKLVMFSEEQFDMVLCKNMADAQRLHHTLAKIAKKMKIKSLLFMGTATAPATISQMYEIIHKFTKWPLKKIRRYTTRP